MTILYVLSATGHVFSNAARWHHVTFSQVLKQLGSFRRTCIVGDENVEMAFLLMFFVVLS